MEEGAEFVGAGFLDGFLEAFRHPAETDFESFQHRLGQGLLTAFLAALLAAFLAKLVCECHGHGFCLRFLQRFNATGEGLLVNARAQDVAMRNGAALAGSRKVPMKSLSCGWWSGSSGMAGEWPEPEGMGRLEAATPLWIGARGNFNHGAHGGRGGGIFHHEAHEDHEGGILGMSPVPFRPSCPSPASWWAIPRLQFQSGVAAFALPPQSKGSPPLQAQLLGEVFCGLEVGVALEVGLDEGAGLGGANLDWRGGEGAVVSRRKLGPMTRTVQVAILLAGAAVLVVAVSGCGTPAEKAAREMKRQGIPFTADEFVARAGRGDLPVLKLFVAAGHDPRAVNAEGLTALAAAAEAEKTLTLGWLAGLGVPVNQRGRGGEPLLVMAVRTNLRFTMDELLRWKADLEMADAAGLTALAHAVAQGDRVVSERLLLAGASAAAPAPGGMTLLAHAVEKGDRRMAALLLRHGAVADGALADGRTLLAAAVAKRDLEMASLLLEGGAKADAASGDGRSLVAVAVEGQDAAMAGLLLEKGADPNDPGGDGRPLLHGAVAAGRAEMVRLLVRRGANLNARDGAGWALAHYAIAENRVGTLRMLLESGADWRLATGDGMGPVTLAVRHRAMDALWALVERGAGVAEERWAGQPLELLPVAWGDAALLRVLLEAGGDPNAPFATPPSPEFAAHIQDYEKFTGYVKTDRGLTALMLACLTGDAECARLLLEAGANKSARTKKWRYYPINIAAQQKRVAVQRVLLGKPPEHNGDGAHVRISLGDQRAVLTVDGKVVRTAPVSTGRRGYRTPQGEYVVTDKHRHWVSTLYHVPMPYFMRLSCGAIGLHAGIVPDYPASHGCIRLPSGAAREFFQHCDVGTLVTITD